MDIQQVKNAVKEIKRIASDSEAAHIWEDNLWQEVLTSIAIGADNAQELAMEALKTKKIKFFRRCGE